MIRLLLYGGRPVYFLQDGHQSGLHRLPADLLPAADQIQRDDAHASFGCHPHEYLRNANNVELKNVQLVNAATKMLLIDESVNMAE